MKEYRKAVRDHIPAIIRSQGTDCEVQECNDPAFLRYLEYKLIEELEEYLESKDAEELADLVEVCYRVAELRGVLPEELEQIRLKKAALRGGFTKNLVLISVDGEEREAVDEAEVAGSTEEAKPGEADAKAGPERKMLLCTCGEGDHYVEDE